MIQEYKRIEKEITVVDRKVLGVMLLECCKQSQITTVEKFGKLQGFCLHASEREMAIDAAEKKKGAEGAILEHVKKNKFLNRIAIFISLFCTNCLKITFAHTVFPSNFLSCTQAALSLRTTVSKQLDQKKLKQRKNDSFLSSKKLLFIVLIPYSPVFINIVLFMYIRQ
jgi:hypothetical protein